jgi:hypothetical protein
MVIEAKVAKNEARIDGHDVQIKVLFKDIDTLDEDMKRVSDSVVRLTTLVGLATPIVTALLVSFMAK